MKVVETDNLTRIYGSGEAQVIALDHVSLHVDTGEFAAVMGPSGCGKSTLLHLVGGLDRPTEGMVKIEGQDLSALDDDDLTDLRRQRIGFIFQFFNLIPTLNALDNTVLPLVLGGMKPADAQLRAAEWLEKLEVNDRSTHRPEELSGGQRQALTMLMATLLRPEVLLLDEHIAALDPKTATQILGLTKDIISSQNLTALMITHNMRHAIDLGNRLIMLHQGRIILDVKGDEKMNLSVEDLLEQFYRVQGEELANDSMLLA